MSQRSATGLDNLGANAAGAASMPVRTPGREGGRPSTRPALEMGVAEELVWCVLAGVSYIGVSVVHKFLLNWIIGPLWLVGVMVVGPAITAAIRGVRHR